MPRIRSILGHVSLQEQLQQDLAADNVSHAYLFSGARHLGKMTTANWFASEILLQGLENEERKEVLGSIERLTHPDILSLDQLWIEGVCEDWDVIAKSSNVPQQHRSKKPGAKTDIISIDDVRSLQERLQETGIGERRVCLIRSIERMQDAAANAFLKILEEPPKGLVFLLTTQSYSKLLPTIISRTRVVRFWPLSTTELKSLLEGVASDDAQFLLHIAQGAPGIVQELKEDPDLLRLHKQIHGQAQSFWHATSLMQRLQILKPLHDRGEEARQFLLHLALSLREEGSAPSRTAAFSRLVRDLETNTHRQLLAQRFAMEISN